MRRISPNPQFPEIFSTDTPARWKCPKLGGYIRIRDMQDSHLLNAIAWAIRRGGNKLRKLDALVAEAVRRRLPLPEHKWIKRPAGYSPTVKLFNAATEPAVGQAWSGMVYSEFGAYNPALRD